MTPLSPNALPYQRQFFLQAFFAADKALSASGWAITREVSFSFLTGLPGNQVML